MIYPKKFSIIIYDSPISRAYMQVLFEQNIVLDEVFYLNPKKNIFIPNYITSHINYKKNNFYPLKFINDINIKKIIFNIENYFSIKKNFINNMFNFDLIYKISKKINYINSESINSNELLKKLKGKKLLLFNTGKEIIKKEILSEFDLIHIHPGYLPEFRGADNSLHMILNTGNIGVSSFFVNEGIDTGKIISRKKWLFKKFDFELHSNFTLNEKYMFWYSFIDPLLRASEFKNIINSESLANNLVIQTNQSKEVGNYYSYMKKDKLELVFKKIF
jgi:folate-dependent phosphoribosylglycinamide formyltransferase PurN